MGVGPGSDPVLQVLTQTLDSVYQTADSENNQPLTVESSNDGEVYVTFTTAAALSEIYMYEYPHREVAGAYRKITVFPSSVHIWRH